MKKTVFKSPGVYTKEVDISIVNINKEQIRINKIRKVLILMQLRKSFDLM